MRLIDANRLYDVAEEKYMEDRAKTENVITRAMLSQARQRIQELIAYAPSVDAEPVVRCKDCKYGELYSRNDGCTGVHCNCQISTFIYSNDHTFTPVRNEDDFCSYGERRDGGGSDVSD